MQVANVTTTKCPKRILLYSLPLKDVSVFDYLKTEDKDSHQTTHIATVMIVGLYNYC